MRSSFRYHFDRRTIIVSILALVLCAGGAILLYMLYMGGFFSAWFVSFVMAIFALMILSIPRRIILLDNKLEIQCVFDITEIDLQEISRIRKVSNRRLRWTMLLFGSSGFCGYYGKFFDLKEFEVITIYSSEWNNFVEITDIYDSRIYVSCRDADELIAAVRSRQQTTE
jgi:hypothetical protein